MARVNWQRRLPLAVYADVQLVRDGTLTLRGEAADSIVEVVLAEACLLEGMAQAYLRDIEAAHRTLMQAQQGGMLSVEGAVQLLIVAEPEFPEIAVWAAQFIPPDIGLGGRASARLLRTNRRMLLKVMSLRTLPE
jgi:hypothetical protein